jgi:hypothetical protein
MREGDAGRNVPLSASGFALGTSPQRGEVPSAARRRGVYLIGEADE